MTEHLVDFKRFPEEGVFGFKILIPGVALQPYCVEVIEQDDVPCGVHKFHFGAVTDSHEHAQKCAQIHFRLLMAAYGVKFTRLPSGDDVVDGEDV